MEVPFSPIKTVDSLRKRPLLPGRRGLVGALTFAAFAIMLAQANLTRAAGGPVTEALPVIHLGEDWEYQWILDPVIPGNTVPPTDGWRKGGKPGENLADRNGNTYLWLRHRLPLLPWRDPGLLIQWVAVAFEAYKGNDLL